MIWTVNRSKNNLHYSEATRIGDFWLLLSYPGRIGPLGVVRPKSVQWSVCHYPLVGEFRPLVRYRGDAKNIDDAKTESVEAAIQCLEDQKKRGMFIGKLIENAKDWLSGEKK